MRMFDRQKEVTKIQALVNGIVGSLNENSERVFEPYIITSSKFQSAISNARKKLNIAGLQKVDEHQIIEWILEHLGGNPKNPITEKTNAMFLKEFYQAVDSALHEAELPESWREYIAIYIVTEIPPDSKVLGTKPIAQVENVTDSSMTITFRKGMRHEEYIKLWSAISKFLGPGRRKNKMPDADKRIRDIQMHGKKQAYGNKLSYSELSKEYLPETDVEYAKDTIKKAIKRQKKLFDEGTNLAK